MDLANKKFVMSNQESLDGKQELPFAMHKVVLWYY